MCYNRPILEQRLARIAGSTAYLGNPTHELTELLAEESA
jgi:hypothetical protein